MGVLRCASRLADFDEVMGISESAGTSYADSNYGAYGLYSSNSNIYDYCMLGGIAALNAESSKTIWLHLNLKTRSGSTRGSDGILVYDENGEVILKLTAVISTTVGVSITLYGDTSVTSNSASAIPSGSSVKWDFKITSNSSTISVDWYFDGNLFASLSAGNTGGKGTLNSVKFCPYVLNYISTASFSEVIISTTSTIGQRLKYLTPAAAGAHTDGTGSYADLSDGSESTGVELDAATEKFSWRAAGYSGASASIAAIMVNSRSHRVSGNPSKLANLLRVGSTDYTADSTTIGDSTLVASKWLMNPATSAAWATADLVNLQYGFRADD